MHTNIVLDTGVFATDGLNPSNFHSALREALGGDSSATFGETKSNFLMGYSYHAYLIDSSESVQNIKVKVTPVTMVVNAESDSSHSFQFYNAQTLSQIIYKIDDSTDSWGTDWSGSNPDYRLVVTISRNEF